MTYANKLFSKRCEYISHKKDQNIKRRAIHIWNV
jgi:hypothetical protein